MGLSFSTAGSHLYWQDSGFFLVAVRDLGVLYPPGFPLYLVLCKAWACALGFIDFTYAVHLFSAVCAAGAAGTIAVAARDLLRTKGPIFRTTQEEGPLADWVGASIGCLAASGYTFWSAALLAKVYALYFLVLSLLVWSMIRADESGKPRDLSLVAVLIGLAWQAHPSAASLGLAFLLFAFSCRRRLDVKGWILRIGLAALSAIAPALLLPVLAAREPPQMFGNPITLGTWAEYLAGSGFTRHPGAFGLDGGRVASVGRYFWEEFLGVGALLTVLGLYRLWRSGRRLLWGFAAAVVPVLVVTVLFKIEGQHDYWMVAAWIPLWMVAAVGLSTVGRARELAVLLALAGTGWAVGVNRPDLDQRNYVLAEVLGHLHLDRLDPGSVLLLSSDDALASTLYLQRVKGVRPDITVVQAPLLGRDPDWYDRQLEHRHPFLKPPEYADLRGRFPGASAEATALAAFANANAAADPPVFFERPPSPEMLRPEWTLEPAGHLLKLVRRGQQGLDVRYWTTPIEAEGLPALYRRPRGQFLQAIPGGLAVRPESYEHRLLRVLLRARKNRADWLALTGTLDGFRRSAELYESILALDPWMAEDPGAVVPLAKAHFGERRYDLAEPWLLKSLRLSLPPAIRAQICCLLAEIYRTWNRPDEVRAWSNQALAIPELPLELRKKLESH